MSDTREQKQKIKQYPVAVRIVVGKLCEAGYAAYMVGGCVRDSLLGRSPKDWDVTTSATPEEVLETFCAFRTIPTGIKHGTVTVLIDGLGVEVTTFRVDGAYSDSRRPDSVKFTGNLTEDLARRDFTVNAMAYNEREGFCDPWGGKADLEAKIIRAVGEPEVRFREDALRILRAVRFATTLGFEIEEHTAQALTVCREGLSRISAERIFAELTKILESPGAARGIGLLEKYKLLPFVLPALYREGTARLPNPAVLDFLPQEAAVRLAYLLRGQEPAAVREVLQFLKPSNAFSEAVVRLTKASLPQEIHAPAARRFCAAYGDLTESALTLIAYDGAESAEAAETLLCLATEIFERGDCLTLENLALTGKDLITAGYPPSPQIGEILDALLQAVLDNPRLNQRETLLTLAENQFERKN